MSNPFPPNASILRDGGDGSSYGVHLREDGTVAWCSEHTAGLDPRGPVAWLREHYPDHTFTILRDGGATYRADLHDALFGGCPPERL